jgi:hypothetical protein
MAMNDRERRGWRPGRTGMALANLAVTATVVP